MGARTYAATGLNFFFPGAGYMILGRTPVLAIGWLVGAIGLTVVELQLQALDPALYWTMFASVFVMNTAFAIDAYRTGKERERTLAGA